MRTLFFIVITLMVTSCSYRVTNNYYNCCPQQASWIDTIGTLGNHTIHAVGTRKDITYIFSQTTFTNIKGFKIVEVVGTNYTIEVRNPIFKYV